MWSLIEDRLLTKLKALPAAKAAVTLDVQGMTCAACVGHVERALLKTPGVTQAAVNLLAQKHPINSALSLIVVMGSLAVIGPTRIDYQHTMTAVSYIARLFDKILNESGD